MVVITWPGWYFFSKNAIYPPPPLSPPPPPHPWAIRYLGVQDISTSRRFQFEQLRTVSKAGNLSVPFGLRLPCFNVFICWMTNSYFLWLPCFNVFICWMTNYFLWLPCFNVFICWMTNSYFLWLPCFNVFICWMTNSCFSPLKIVVLFTLDQHIQFVIKLSFHYSVHLEFSSCNTVSQNFINNLVLSMSTEK